MFKIAQLTRLSVLVIIILLNTSNSFGQTKYDQGFEDGYKKGYCSGDLGCVTVSIPPVPPSMGESIDSYQDGFGEGFKMGLDAQKKSKDAKTKQGYKTTIDSQPIDYMHKPTELETKIASKGEQNFETGMKRAHELYNEGKYSDCIGLCHLINNLTHLVSSKYYSLLALSYSRLGDKRNSNRYYKKSIRLQEKGH